MDTKLLQAFNKQINYEFYSAYLYFAMSTYFDEIVMVGFGDFMRTKAAEKLNNAHSLYDYLILRDEKLVFSKIEEPQADWINVTDVFQAALSHEEFILIQLNDLFKEAKQVEDFAALEFISKLISDETKTLGMIRKLVFRIKNANIISSNASVEHLDYVINDMKI